eukprot:scaffold18581_cov54-Cylindrotheca_fusiformis.AAC.1
MATTTPNQFVYAGQKPSEVPRNVLLLKLESGIVQIQQWSFPCLLSLREVELPDQLCAIGNHAFFRCVSLEKINFPRSLKAIGNNAFEDCRALEAVRLPNGLKSI